MKKVLVFVFIVAACLLVYTAAFADAYGSNAAITAKMNEIKNNSLPDGKYWNAGKNQAQLIAGVETWNWTPSNLGVTDTGCRYNGYSCSCHGYSCTSNSFSNGSQCYGFARFVGYLLWPELGVPEWYATYNGYAWTRVDGSAVSSVTLEPGDIICEGSQIHSAIVWKVSGSTVYVAEVWGTHSTGVGQKNHGSPVGCQIAWGYYNGDSANASMSTILNKVRNAGGYILKHPTSPEPAPTTLEFRDVVYPKTFKIDTRNGWYLQGGKVVSDVNLTSIRSIITRLSDYTNIDDTGDIAISGKSYALSTIDAWVKFSNINTAGKYAWILIAKDSAGKELCMVLSFDAVASGSTSTEKRSTSKSDPIPTPPSPGPTPIHITHEVHGDTGGSTTFWVKTTSANASIELKSYQGIASVAQHNSIGIYTGDGDETHFGFYLVNDSLGRSFHWGPDATANKNEIKTSKEVTIMFPNPGVYSVTVVPLAYSDVNHYWIMDTINHWKTQAQWEVKSESGCKATCTKPDPDPGPVPSSAQLTATASTMQADGTFTVTLGITNNPGFAYLTLNSDYASKNVSLESSEVTGIASGASFTQGTSSILQNASNLTGDGAILILKFIAQDVKEITISFSCPENYDQWLNDVTISAVNITVKTSERHSGDINGDGKVNGKDSLLLIQYLAGWNVTIKEGNADVSGDGKVNGKDSLLLIQYLAGWNVTLK